MAASLLRAPRCAPAAALMAGALLLGSVSLGTGAASAAESCPNEQLRTEASSTYLPDCRAYELVSPSYKEGHPLITTFISPDGSRVIAEGFGAFSGTEGDPRGAGLGGASYSLARTASGWVATALTPPAASFVEDFSLPGQLVSQDFTTTSWILSTPAEPTFQRDLYLRNGGGAMAFVVPMTPPSVTNEDEILLLGGSSSLSRMLFTLSGQLWPGDTTKEGTSLYEATVGEAGSEPKLVAVTNTGALAHNGEAKLIGNCGATLGGHENVANAVSSDGTTAIFTVSACEGAPAVGELYGRINGSTTVALSEPSPLQCTSSACTKAAETERQEGIYQGASADSSKVFFMTAQPLVNSDEDTTNDLYQAEISVTGLHKLIQVSKGDATDPAPGAGAKVLGTSAVSEDGSRVYFVAEGVLTTATNKAGQGAVLNAPNLYLVEPATGKTTFVTTLQSGDTGVWTPGSNLVHATPDGRFLTFDSAEHLFLYDSASGALTAIPSGGLAAGPEAPASGSLSRDGAYVVFASRAALAPRAASGVLNVYEYHDGQVFLISDGQDVNAGGALLLGLDASGANVFFETLDPLVTQDRDTLPDVYDARIGGGFAAVHAPSGCSAEGCSPAANAAPVFLSPATIAQAGGDNLPPPPPPPPPKHKHKPPPKHKHKHKRTKRHGRRAARGRATSHAEARGGHR